MSLPEHEFVETAAGLGPVADRVASAPWVALDTESNSMHVYRERVCLLQLNVDGGLAIVDPIALGAEALQPLLDALAAAPRVYLHGGEYDVAVLKREYDLSLTGVFDTQQAASYLGWNRTGYAAAVEEIVGITLAKGHAQYDWGLRPIEEQALAYALDDVRYLPAVAEGLIARIAEADIEDEVAHANRAVEAAAPHKRGFDPVGVYRLKGLRDLDDAQRAVAFALFQWRDGAAESEDRPPGRLLANEALVALARRSPTTRNALRRGRLKSRVVNRHGDDILSAIQGALASPPTLPEEPRKPRPPKAERDREGRLKKWRREEAERRGVGLQVVLPTRSLEHLAKHGAADLDAVPMLGAKRRGLYGTRLAALCD